MSNVRSSVIKHTLLLCTIFFVTMLLYYGNASADITSGKYGVNQVFDCQRSPAYPNAGASFTASNFAKPYRDNGATTQYQMNPGEYIQFYYPSGLCSGGNVGIKRYDAMGNLIEIIATNGTIRGLENQGFLFISIPGDYGTFVSNAAGYVYGQSVTYTTTAAGAVNCTTLDAYVPSTTPLTPSAPEINLKQGATNIASAGTHNFGNVTLGSSSGAITFTIENTGSADLTLSGTPKIVKGGADAADFTVDQSGITSPIAASGNKSFTVTFTPSSAAGKTALISIANDDSDENPYTVTLNGTGMPTAPEINLKQGATNIASAGTHNFGNVTLGSSSGAITFTIENTGSADLTLSGTPKIVKGGADAADFTVDQSGITSPIAASGNKSFTVTFTPSSAAGKTALISIANDDSDENPYTLNLSGTGTTVPVTAGVGIVSVTDVRATTALATGTASGAGIGERGFFWWTDGGFTSGTVASGYGAGDFSLTMSNLMPLTAYHVSSYIKVGAQLITSGNKISFTTTGPVLPTVITKPDFTVNVSEVLVKGEITDVGSSPVTIYGFVYAVHTSPTVWDMALPFTWDMTLPISHGKAFEGTIKNLAPGTYYFRAYAHNAQGTAYGEEYSFTIFGPGFTVTPTGGLVTSESGTTSAFTVKLNTQPAADVTVAVSSSDTAEGTVSPASLTFTSQNWNTPQTVTVTGADDTVTDGDRNYTAVLAAAVSDDPVYNGLKPADVAAVNKDNDTPTPTDHAPTANPQTLSTDQNTALAITLTGSDPDGDTFTYAVLTAPQHGTLSGTAPNLTYTPAAGYSGSDSFTFRTNDGKSDSVPATVSITVNPVGTGDPVYSSFPAPGGTLTMGSYSPANATAILKVTNIGTAVLNITGITFGGAREYPAKFSVSDTFPVSIAAGANRVFTVTGNGSTAGTFTATMEVAHNAAGSPANYTLNSVISVYNQPAQTGDGGYYAPSANQTPVADKLYVSDEKNKAIPVKLTGSDADAPHWFLLLLKPLIYSVVTQPAHGTLSGTPPNLIYTPDTDFVGTDSFTYRIYDGTAYSAESLVAIIVHENSHAYVGEKYELDIFCAEYQGVRYGFRLNYAPVTADPSGLYWKMDILTFGKAYSTDIKGCIPVGNDLRMNIPSAYFQGTLYQFTLNYNPISGDPSGLYWKMDLDTLKSR